MASVQDSVISDVEGVDERWMNGLEDAGLDIALGMEPHAALGKIIMEVASMKTWVNVTQVPLLSAAMYLLSQVAEDCSGTRERGASKPRPPQSAGDLVLPVSEAAATTSATGKQTSAAAEMLPVLEENPKAGDPKQQGPTPCAKEAHETPRSHGSKMASSLSSINLSEAFGSFAASHPMSIFPHPSTRHKFNHDHSVTSMLNRHQEQEESRNPLKALPGFKDQIMSGALTLKRKVQTIAKPGNPHVVIGGAKDMYNAMGYDDFVGNITRFSHEHVPFCGKHCMIYPDSTFRIVWDCLAFLLIILAFFTVPFELAFDVEVKSWSDGLRYCSILIEMFFILDMVLSFNTAYYSGGLIVTRRSIVTVHY